MLSKCPVQFVTIMWHRNSVFSLNKSGLAAVWRKTRKSREHYFIFLIVCLSVKLPTSWIKLFLEPLHVLWILFFSFTVTFSPLSGWMKKQQRQTLPPAQCWGLTVMFAGAGVGLVWLIACWQTWVAPQRDGAGLSRCLAESGFGATLGLCLGPGPRSRCGLLFPHLDNITLVPWARQGAGADQARTCRT